MPRRPTSPPWCWKCLAPAEETKLYAVHLARPYTDTDGRRRTRSIPIRVCRACVTAAISASDRARRELVVESRKAPRVRTAGGTFASRAQMAASR